MFGIGAQELLCLGFLGSVATAFFLLMWFRSQARYKEQERLAQLEEENRRLREELDDRTQDDVPD